MPSDEKKMVGRNTQLTNGVSYENDGLTILVCMSIAVYL